VHGTSFLVFRFLIIFCLMCRVGFKKEDKKCTFACITSQEKKKKKQRLHTQFLNQEKNELKSLNR